MLSGKKYLNQNKIEEKNLEELINSLESPEFLTNDIINLLGDVYLKKHPETTMLHCSQDIAGKLKNYNEKSTVEEKWRFFSSYSLGNA